MELFRRRQIDLRADHGEEFGSFRIGGCRQSNVKVVKNFNVHCNSRLFHVEKHRDKGHLNLALD